MRKSYRKDFYEIQSQQWKKSLFLFVILLLFYFVAVGFITIVVLFSFGLIISGGGILSKQLFLKILWINSLVSLTIASFHFYEARKFGAKFIRKRLGAQPPDLSDRYHKQFANTVDEIRIAAGLPQVNAFIIPTFAINSMALIEADKTPSVIITEGLLADFTRDELQAVVSHELAHVIRGDSFYLTLVCSLANFFERFRQTLEPESYPQAGQYQTAGGGGGHILVYIAVTLSSIIMHLLSTLVSRQREIYADATAVELIRDPRALARSIYKAHLKNSFIGDFNLTYSPLFIVPPESKGESEGFFARIFSSHPPLMKRIRMLADMAKIRSSSIVRDVWEIQKNREKARFIQNSLDERTPEEIQSTPTSEEILQKKGKLWLIRNSKGKWEGPYSLQELLFLRIFSPMIRIKNIQEGIEAQAREFPAVRQALKSLGRKKPISLAKHNRCPHCNVFLRESYYEGVSIKICSQCQGKLVDSVLMERIVARKEIAFSDHLMKKAEKFKEEFLNNPVDTKKISLKKISPISCPNCGTRMLQTPYTYHYIIPVDKCLSCYKIWFDKDELEILQILVETRFSE